MLSKNIEALAFGLAVAVGSFIIPAIISSWYSRKKLRPKPPGPEAKWKYVGNLANITIYPLKSCKGIDLKKALCTQFGLMETGEDNSKLPLRDRYFMIFREDNGEMVTGRIYSNLLQCSIASESNSSVRISYPGKADLFVEIPKGNKKLTRMWQQEPVECYDCGDEAAEWMTNVVNINSKELGKTTLVRLGYWSPTSVSRKIVEAWAGIEETFKGITNNDGGAFSDFTSYMLMISSSVDELNKRLENGVQISNKNFRPNFYVQSNEAPFSDLNWKWVRIGDNVFRWVKGCKRCLLTTIDPGTSLKLPNNEPLTTLNKMEEAKVKKPIEESPMMGIHLGSYAPGCVSIGDPVYAIIDD